MNPSDSPEGARTSPHGVHGPAGGSKESSTAASADAPEALQQEGTASPASEPRQPSHGDERIGLANERSRGRILVADDDDSFRENLVRFLNRRGFECEGAPDAPTAARLLRGSDFELLISDIDMPGNAGLELVRDLPQLAAGLPVILLTGHATVETAVQSVRYAVTAYLMKPADLEALIDLSQEAISKYRALRSLTTHQRRLQDWCHDLDRIRTLVRDTAGSNFAAPWQTFLTLSLGHIIESLVDLRAFTQALAPHGDPAVLSKRLESSQPLVLIEALRETISVLERTKGAFKSRELGDLRKKLEQLVAGSRGPKPPGPG